MQALKQWRHYILGKETIIHTDHKPLQFAPSQSKWQRTRQMKWISYLQQFELVIKHRKGKANTVADCLSWPPVASLLTVWSMHGYYTITWPRLYEEDTSFHSISTAPDRSFDRPRLPLEGQFALRARIALCTSRWAPTKDYLGCTLQQDNKSLWSS